MRFVIALCCLAELSADQRQAGVLNAAPTPKGTEPPKYGPASALALDDNGDPVIAFELGGPERRRR